MIHLALWIASLLFLAWVGFHFFRLPLKLCGRILYDLNEAWVRSSKGFKTSIIVTFGLTAAYLLWVTLTAVYAWYWNVATPQIRDEVLHVLGGVVILALVALARAAVRESPPTSPTGQIKDLQRQVHDPQEPAGPHKGISLDRRDVI